jgi:surfeit locus 1 family protein
VAARLRALIVPGFLALAAIAVLVSLGNWQMRRLAWKEELIANAAERPSAPVQDLPPPSQWLDLDIEEAEFRRFRLTGRFLHDKEAWVFTSLGEPKGKFGGPGYWIVTPFALENGGSVLVNRGFAPQDRHRPPDRGEALNSGRMSVSGLLRPDEERSIFTPDDRSADNFFFARQVDPIATAKGLEGPVAPFTIDLLAAETPPGGLPQAGETRVAFTNNHFQYALTWYGLALALAGVFASFAWSRWRGDPRAPRLTPPGGAP